MDPFERGRHGKLLTEAERGSRSGVVWPQGSTASDAVYPLLHEIAPQPSSDVVYPLLSELNPQPSSDVVYPLLSELNPQPSSDVVYPLLHELRPQPPDDVVYLQMPNESRRWPSPVAFPIVQANGVVGVPGWSGGAGQQGLTELEGQRQQQMRPDVAGGFPESPYIRDPQPPLLTDLERQTRQHLEPSLLNVLPNTFSPQYPLHHNFSVTQQPEILSLYIRDAFSDSPRPAFSNMIQHFDAYSNDNTGVFFIAEGIEPYKPSPKGDKKGGFGTIPTRPGWNVPDPLPIGKAKPEVPDVRGKQAGPLLLQGYGSYTNMIVEVLSGLPDKPIPTFFFFPSFFKDVPDNPIYPRGTVEYWAYWFFRVTIPRPNVPRPHPTFVKSFAFHNDPSYRLLVQPGILSYIKEDVKAEIRGEVYVSIINQNQTVITERKGGVKKEETRPANSPVPLYVAPVFGFPYNLSPTDPRNLDAHQDRALDWQVSLAQPYSSSQTRILSRDATSLPPSTQQTHYSFELPEVGDGFNPGPSYEYLVTYVDYIRVDNGNGTALASLATAPTLLLGNLSPK